MGSPRVAVLLLVLVGLTACSSDDEPAPTPATPPATSDSDPPAPGDEQPAIDLAGTEACDLVRQGIDAFNLGDLERTVALFEDAVPPAEDLARDQPSPGTETLLAAVRYYAALAPEDYPEANAGSPEFAEFQVYKDFTLRECAYGSAPVPSPPTETGIPA